ncbi:MAG: hypothetical protein ACRBDL_08475 [Alphaproteobacteria bacterium]
MKIRWLIALFLVSMSLGTSVVHAKKPAIIEFFSQYDCVREGRTHEALYDILKNEQDVIVVSCIEYHEGLQDYVDGWMHEFCKNRRSSYKRLLGMGLGSSSLIVNGRWYASHANVKPALDMARHDQIADIHVRHSGDTLDVEIPAVKGADYGELILYVYMPTRADMKVYVDADVEFTDSIRNKIKNNQSVPFVTKARSAPLLVRPVFEMIHLGKWYGDAVNFSYPLGRIHTEAGPLYNALSYAVVLHQGAELGPVLAIGEERSSSELSSLLPKSKPLEIEFSSLPFNPQDLGQ